MKQNVTKTFFYSLHVEHCSSVGIADRLLACRSMMVVINNTTTLLCLTTCVEHIENRGILTVIAPVSAQRQRAIICPALCPWSDENCFR